MKTPLLLLGICASFYVSAQTIELSDTIYTGNSTTYYVVDSSAASLSEITGAGSIWDYSEIGAYGIAPNVNDVVNSADNAFGDEFVSAMYAENFENGVNTFFSNSPGTNEVIVHGFVFQEESNDFIIKYNVDELISYKFPMNLGDTYTDPIAGEAIVPIAGSVAVDGDATVTADGTGTLIVGGVTYTNVIRVHTLEFTSGAVDGIPGATLDVERDSYVYYDIDNFNMPVFIHASVFASLGLAGEFGFTAVYSRNEITDMVGVEENAAAQQLSVYPNPAVSGFTTVTCAENTEVLTVLNSLGEVIYTVNSPSMTENINVEGFSTGIYFVQSTKEGAVSTVKFIVK